MATIACQRCKQVFEAKKSDTCYCPICRPVVRREYLHNYEHGRRKIACPRCGKPMGNRAAMCRDCNNKAQPWRKVGEENSNWKGGRTEAGGYVYLRHKHIPGGPGQSYRAEHILVWEKTNGPLPKGWVVHHFNGIKNDNRPENLFGEPRKHHNPRQVVQPYQERIIELEKQLQELQ